MNPLPRDRLRSSIETPDRSTITSPGGSRESVAPIPSPGVSSLPGLSLSECIAACNSPEITALRISATNAPPLPPCGNSLLVWSVSPVVSNLTISTSISGAAAVSRRAISSVWTSAMALLRVPIRIRIATTHAPFEAAQDLRLFSGRKHKASLCRKANARPALPVLPRILQDHVSGFFSDHDHRRVGITRNQVRHDRGVYHTQAFDAAKTKPRIDHGKRIASHSARRCRMIDRAAALPAEIQQFLIGRNLYAGINLLRHIGTQRRRLQDLSQYLQTFDIGGAIDFGGEVVDAYFGRRRRVGTPDAKRATALGPQFTDRRPESGKPKQLLSPLVRGGGREVDLDMGCRKARAGLEERSRRATPDIQIHFLPFSTDKMGEKLHSDIGCRKARAGLEERSRRASGDGQRTLAKGRV